jgi:hypothetical protein
MDDRLLARIGGLIATATGTRTQKQNRQKQVSAAGHQGFNQVHECGLF